MFFDDSAFLFDHRFFSKRKLNYATATSIFQTPFFYSPS